MRIFVCSPLRGPDGQPSEKNVLLARKLMRAVFDAGHQPFVPHLLYPQVLSESETDLQAAFAANFAWLDVSEELWVYGRSFEQCSNGMRREIMRALNSRRPPSYEHARVVYMPPPFEEVEHALAIETLKGMLNGVCEQCRLMGALNTQGLCLKCFAGGSPA